MAQNTFSSLNIDPIEGTEIMQLIGVDMDELNFPATFNKLQAIVKFFQGKEDKRFIINKLTAGKPGVNKLDHIFGYVQVRSDYEKTLNEKNAFKLVAETVSKEQGIDKARLLQMFEKEDQLNKLQQELTIYEK